MLDQRVLIDKIKGALEEIQEISRTKCILYTAGGVYFAGTEPEEEEDEAVCQFFLSPAENQIIGKWVYFRVEIHGQTEYILKCTKEGDMDNLFVIGRMAVCQIRNLILAIREPEDRETVFRMILTGEMTGDRLAEKFHQFRLKYEDCMLFVIYYQKDEDHILTEVLKNLFVSMTMDFVVEMDDHKTVLIKTLRDIPNRAADQYAQTVAANIQSEAMIDVRVSCSNPCTSFDQLADAYREACGALSVGMLFYEESHIFCSGKLGLGGLIYEVPQERCELFLKEVLGDLMDVEFDEETLTTINCLFANNLNISETARQLYVHRNTLVYRLERIEKRLGLDIRTFEDAMMFKIAMMVRTRLRSLRET